MLREGVLNSHLAELDRDFLYHLGLDTSMNLREIFGGVKYVCMGGSPNRADTFAHKAAEELGISVPEGGFRPIGKTERCSLYRVGPIISVSHGMGMPSMSIFLHELTKLLHYAGCEDVTYIRIGTSGGVGVDPGTVVVADGVLNDKLKPVFEHVELGEVREYPAELDRELAEEILAARGDIHAVLGTTLGTNDFYEGQARSDGALEPSYTPEEAIAFMQRLYEMGVRNIEMESVLFAAFCLRAGIPAALVCTTLLDRLQGDQVTSAPEELARFSDNAQTVVLRYIRGKLGAAVSSSDS